MHFTMLDRIDPGSATFWKKIETTLRVAKDHCASLGISAIETSICHTVMQDFIHAVQPKKPKDPLAISCLSALGTPLQPLKKYGD